MSRYTFSRPPDLAEFTFRWQNRSGKFSFYGRAARADGYQGCSWFKFRLMDSIGGLTKSLQSPGSMVSGNLAHAFPAMHDFLARRTFPI